MNTSEISKKNITIKNYAHRGRSRVDFNVLENEIRSITKKPISPNNNHDSIVYEL